MNERKRLQYISIAQAIACLLVLLGHSYPFDVEIPGMLNYLRSFIYDFHMPLFIFISGFLVVKADSINKYGRTAYIKKRAYKLLIPYFAISIIGIIPKLLMNGRINDEFGLTPQYIIRAFLVPRENIWGHFWFIPMIFGLSVLSLLFVKVLDKSKAWFGILLVVLALINFIPPITGWFSINDIKDFAFYYAFGMFTASNVFLEKEVLGKKRNALLFPFALAIFFVKQTFTNFNSVGISTGIIIAITMIFFVLWLSNLQTANLRLLGRLSKNIYPVFILSWPAQAVVEQIANKILGLNVYVVIPLMFAAGLFVPLIIIQIVKFIELKTPIKFLSPIIGR